MLNLDRWPLPLTLRHFAPSGERPALKSSEDGQAWQPVCDQPSLYQADNLTLHYVHYINLLRSKSTTEAYSQSVSRVPEQREFDPRSYHLNAPRVHINAPIEK